jgi:hypothetical protein
VWFGVLGKKAKPLAWNFAAGYGGEAYGVMGAGFDLRAVEIDIDGLCAIEFPSTHPRTGARATFAQQCLWRWLEEQDLEVEMPDLLCGGLPCAGYSSVPQLGAASLTERSVHNMRLELEDLERRLGKKGHFVAWWLENVPQAKEDMTNPTSLCAAAFGLPLFRHRLFDSNFGVAPVPCQHQGMCISTRSPYRQSLKYQLKACRCGGNTFQLFGGHVGGSMGTVEEHQEALGMSWGADARQLHQCIPPVYALYMGRHALQGLVVWHLQSV